jgi:hypothetical protein
MYVIIFSTTSVRNIFLIPRRKERDMIKLCIGLHVNYTLFVSDFRLNLNFLDRFFEIILIRPVEDELLHADGRTES